MEVKGAFALDYMDKDEHFRKTQLKNARQYHEAQISVQIPLPKRYLCFPAITNPLNIVDFELQSRFCENWIRHYFECSCTHTFTEFVPFYRTPSVLFFKFDTAPSEFI
jgi:hypothetical protein